MLYQHFLCHLHACYSNCMILIELLLFPNVLAYVTLSNVSSKCINDDDSSTYKYAALQGV
jgi:hypothetical protein